MSERVAPTATETAFDHDIPRSRDNPEVRWGYDTEIVSDLIAQGTPVLRHFVTEECQHGGTEVLEGGMAFVVDNVPVHQSQ